MFDEAKQLSTAGVDFEAVVKKTAGFTLHTVGVDSCNRDRELACMAWSEVAGEVHGNSPAQRVLDIIDYV